MSSPENKGTDIVLVLPQETALANTKVHFREFPPSAEGVIRVAIARYMQEQAESAAKAAENEPQIREQEHIRQAALEKAIANPETLREWLINVISTHGPEIGRNIAWQQGMSVNDKYVIGEAIYPVLSRLMVFNVPKSSVRDRIRDQELSEMERFILDYFDDYLLMMRDVITSFFDRRLIDGDALEILNTVVQDVDVSHQPHGRVELRHVINWLVNSFVGLCNKNNTICTNVGWGANATINRKNLQYLLQKKHEENHPVHLLFSSQGVRFTNKLYGSTDAALDYLLDELLPQVDKPAEQTGQKDAKNSVPTFKSLGLLRTQLEVHMQRLATRGKVNGVLEKHLFPDKQITVFEQQYRAAPKKLWFGRTKRKMENGLAQRLNTDMERDVESLLSMLDFCANAYARACLLKKNDASESQRKEADLLFYVVGVYADFLRQVGVELEAKMTVPNLEIPDLNSIVEMMMQFGAAGENTVEIAREAMEDFRTAREAVEEVEAVK